MKVVFLGATNFSRRILDLLFTIQSTEVIAIFGIPKKFNISYSKNKVVNTNFADLSRLAQERQILYYEVDSTHGKRLADFSNIFEKLRPDIILVMGWYYMVPKFIRDTAKYGAWGIHASLLPKYAGGAPLIWAIINGEKITGITLFRLDDGVDDGDIIAQRSFAILETDTIAEVYEKATIESVALIKKIFSKDISEIKFLPQEKSKIEVWPQRKPEDGEIDWSWNPDKIYNFIRAQSKPYPGAWTVINGKKITIWSATVEKINDKE